MKWLVASLLLLNLVVLAWGLTRPAPDLKQLDEDGATLLLLAEVRPAPVSNPGVPSGSEAKVVEPPASLSLKATEGESHSRVLSVVTRRQRVPAFSRGLHFSNTTCRTLGPFTTRGAAQRVAAQLANIQIAARIRKTTGVELGGYWVLMSSLASDAETNETLAALSRAGFENAWLFKDGELANTISLGLYSRERNARRRAKQVREAGFDVWVKPQQQEFERYWLDYRLTPGARLPVRALSLARRIEVGIREYPRRCVDRG